MEPVSSMNPLFYKVAVCVYRLRRRLFWLFSGNKYSSVFSKQDFPFIVTSHKSLLLRKLAGTDMNLQKNKVESLKIAASLINGVMITPGEVFSFWKLVGKPVKRRGFTPGLQLSFGKLTAMVGGGLCQLTNLLHWMVLQTSLKVTERHRHSTDPFPDYKRKVPFGTGTTVFYNYLDFAFLNDTKTKFQIKVWVEEEYLCGEIRSNKSLPVEFSVVEKQHKFVRRKNKVYRENEIWVLEKNKDSSAILSEKLCFKNHVEVLYDTSTISVEEEA